MEPLAPASVENLGEGRVVTLDAVLRSVELHHPPLEAARERVDAAEGQRLAAEGAFDLSVQGRVSSTLLGYYQYGRAEIRLDQPTPLWGASFFGGWRIGRGFNRDIPDYYRYDETLDGGEFRVGATVPLWRDGPIDSRRATLWRSEAGVTAQREEFEARALRVRLAATESHTRWVAAARRYLVARALLELAEARDNQIASRVSAGAVPAIEHLENRRAILERRQALVVARRALEQRAIALSLYLRDDDGAPRIAHFSEVPTTQGLPSEVTESEADSAARALAARPEMRRFAAQRRQGEVSVELAENQLAARIDVTVAGSVDVGGPGTNDPDVARRFQTQYGPPTLDASVLVQVPLQFRDARGRIDQTRSELSALDAEWELARDQIRIEVADVRSAMRAADENMRLASDSLRIAQAVAEAERVRFDNGATSLLVVNMRESMAASAEQALIDAEADLVLAHALYRAATGSE
jgi:outer membrane protein TolC